MRLKLIGDYERAYYRVMKEAMRSFWMDDPVLGNFPVEDTEHSGPIRNVPGQIPLDQPMIVVEFGATVTLNAVRNLDVDAHTQLIAELAKAEEEAIGPSLFEGLSQVSDAVGNSVDAKDKNLHDAYLDMLERLNITFDEEGKPSGLQLIMNPETAKKLKSLPPPTEEQEKRHSEIMNRKKEEFYAKKRTRRLSE